MQLDERVMDKILESTIRIRDIINELYEASPSGSVHGYLILDAERHFIEKKEIRKACTLEGDCPQPHCEGSIVCDIPYDEQTRALAAMVISIEVLRNTYLLFRDNTEEYTFKTFRIFSDLFPEYRYYKDRFWKYRKTGHKIPIFKMDIEW